MKKKENDLQESSLENLYWRQQTSHEESLLLCHRDPAIRRDLYRDRHRERGTRSNDDEFDRRDRFITAG